MSSRLEMLQVARLARTQLHEAADQVGDWLLKQFGEDGGVWNREGDSDLYYTVFGLDALFALEVEAPLGRVQDYLEPFGDGEGLDLVHLACLARCWSSFPDEALPDDRRRRMLNRLDGFRAHDGGYGGEPSSASSTAYHCFLAFGAYQDLGAPAPSDAPLRRRLLDFACPDGGYGNVPGLPVGTTPTTAAVVTLLRQLGEPVPADAGRWLLDRALPGGGFVATPATPLPDLLSTATALHALSGLQRSYDAIREPCFDFIDSLWTGRAFCGNWAEEEADVEYTFYGLLALGHLSL